MTEVFGAHYAGAYDAIYGHKDYAGECDLVLRLVQRHGAPPCAHLLDLGCGTGRHAELFAGRGYTVVGVDRSEAMLAAARRRCPKGARFVCGDTREVVAGEPGTFDVAVMMFAVLSYHTENRDVLAALHNVARHLRRGGLFVFDVWFGPAVLVERPERRSRTLTDAAGRTIRRTVTADLDVMRHRSTVSIDTEISAADAPPSVSHEEHAMRFFFPLELEALLAQAGLTLLQLGKLPQVDETPDTSSWNVIGVARKASPS
ncbi:MAG: class I SAM-dependent methyltransferase [Deltaproteobacteria bacterium]|nr:class I SAM-dependent methyltransferase [Deltaproteobacteria bacterium]